jgi:hypothetical protein
LIHDKAASQFHSEIENEGVRTMARAIMAVVVSYIIFVVFFVLTLNGMYSLLGPDGSFKPGVYDASNAWIGLAFVANLVTAIIAGWICVTLAKTGKAPMGLAITIFVLGFFLAIAPIMAHNANPHMVRTGNVSHREAAQRAIEPIWVPLLFPFIGVAGALIGGRLKRRN